MADYFSIPDDSDLLHPSVRNDDNLQNVVNKVEYDILSEYRNANGKVELQGFDPDPSQTSPQLAKALKHTIAEVVSHRLRVDDIQPGLTGLSRGDRSWSWGDPEKMNRKWPDDWNSLLVTFEMESQAKGDEILWAI